MRSFYRVLFLLALITGPVWAQGLTVEGRGGEMLTFPHGAASFADRVVNFTPGDPPAEPDFCQPESTLGVRNYTYQKDAKKFTSFGKGGEIILEFVDNRLVDVSGDDLYIFEIGPTVEAMFIAISTDGKEWVSVGRISGDDAGIDIGPFVKSGQQFRFVRLKDDPDDGRHSGRTGGADLDAVGALGSVPAP